MRFAARSNSFAGRSGTPCLTTDALRAGENRVVSGWWLVAGTNENDKDSVRHGVPDLPISHQRLATNHYSSSTSHQPLATSHCRSLRDRSGVTILELLIVLLILLMVTAAAIPIMAPALENRRMREAARLASSFISGARSKAIQNGREVGVMFQRFEGKPYAMSMSYVEVPPPYAGGDTNASVQVQDLNTAMAPGNTVAIPPLQTPIGWFTVNISGSCNFNLIRMYDQIQFDFRGPLYTIMGPDANTDGVLDPGGTITVALLTTTGTSQFNWPWPQTPNFSQPMSYQIIRQPRRTSDTPLQLPDGIVIDLLCSGQTLSSAGLFVSAGAIPAQPWNAAWPTSWTTNPPAPYDPIITFTPNGSVGHVITTQTQRATGPIFLLLGRRELMPDVAPIAGGGNKVEDKNIFDSDPTNPKKLYLQNFWMTIGNQTGLVTTSEVTTNKGPIVDPTNYLYYARAFAITSQSIGGR